MQRRRLGRTGNMSSIVTFGGIALSDVSQEEADAAVDLALKYGVNHFDVAPSYGEAELRLAPSMKRHGGEIFLACKTHRRTKGKPLPSFIALWSDWPFTTSTCTNSTL